MYCGKHYDASHKPHQQLTRDHIIPKSRGGKDVWENVKLASCTKYKNF